jgi:signal transduction histidine kinase/CHASE3 domain sensor protein
MKNKYIKILFLGIVMVLLTISVITYTNLKNYTEEVRLIRHSNNLFRSLERVLSTIKDAETGHRGYQLTHDTVYLQPYRASVKLLPAQLRTLEELVAGDKLQSRQVDTLRQLVNYQFAIIQKILTNVQRSSLYMDRYESKLLLDGRTNMNAIRALVHRMNTAEESIYRKRVASETDFRAVTPLAMLGYGFVALAGITVLFVRILDALEKRRIAEEQLKINLKELRSEVGIREFTQKTLRSVLDNSLSSIMAFRAVRAKDGSIEDFEWILANAVSEKMLGLERNTLVGKRMLQTFPKTRHEESWSIYKNVVETGQPAQFEKFQPAMNNSWLQVTCVKFEDGFVVTATDITRQKSQRLLLEERGLLLNEAEHLAKMGSWRWTEKSNELIWSDGLYAMLGKSRETYTPTWDSFLENVYPDDRLLVEDFLREVKENKTRLEIEYRVDVPDALRYLSLVAKPTSPTAETSDVLGALIDITDRKLYEARLEKYTEELQRSNEDLEQFAYVASHDLQEPLRKIRAFGDRLATKYDSKLEGQGVDYIQRMQSAAARMQVLIEDLLSFSRVSRVVAVPEVLDMALVLHEVIDDLDAQVRSEEAAVRLGIVPAILGDKTQIMRLFQNIISNGIKFHKSDEKPVVEIRGHKEKSTVLNARFGLSLTDPEYVVVSVKDNGIGFDEKYTEKIFTLFHRLHGRNEYEGTGIGLSICRKIVNNHKGFITAHSTENVGSEFIIILPAG